MSTFKEIEEIANKTKIYVEKNKELPSKITVNKLDYTYMQVGYLLAKSINNIGKEIKNRTVSKAPQKTGETVKLDIKKADYKELAKSLSTFVESESRLPNYLSYTNKKIKQRVFIYSFAKIIVFYTKNKRLPDTCKFYTSETVSQTNNSSSKNNCTNPYTSEPHYTTQGVGKLGQITNHHCGANALHQGLKKFGITKYNQETIGKYAGTTSSGTAPSGLETAIQKIAKLEGIKLSVKKYYLSDLGSTLTEQMTTIGKMICKSNVFGFTHIGYQDSGEKATGTIFGHYEIFDKIDINKKQIRVLNSLGSKCSSSGYCGHLQWRSFDLEKRYINNKTGIKSIWIVTKQ